MSKDKKMYEESLKVIEEVESADGKTKVMEALAVVSNQQVLDNWDTFNEEEKEKMFEVNTHLLSKYFAYANALKEVRKYEEK